MQYLSALFFCTLLLVSCQSADKSSESDQYTFPELSQKTKEVLEKPSYAFQKQQMGQFRIYYPKGAPVAAQPSRLRNDLDMAMLKVQTVLDRQMIEGMYLVLLDSPQQLQELTGLLDMGLSSPVENLAFVVYNDNSRAQLKQQLFNLLALKLWGPARDPILLRGGGVATANYCKGVETPIYQVAAYLQQNDKFPPVVDLIQQYSEQVNRYGQFMVDQQSAALFQFMYDNFGVRKMRLLWRGGIQRVEEIIGVGPAELGDFFNSHLEHTEVNTANNWERVLEKGCY